MLLYEAFGWTPPEFIHLPLLRNPDKSKLSKRKNPTSILYYKRAGFLPEAVLNYLGLMAYSLPDGAEDFTREGLTATFDIDRVSLGGPVFDLAKLRHFNGRYLRKLSPNALLERAKTWLLNDTSWQQIVPLAQPRLEQLSDLVPMSSFLFADRLDYDGAALLAGPHESERVPELIRVVQWEIEKTAAWTAETARGVFDRVSEKEALKLKQLLPPFYVAFTGTAVALPLFDSLAFMGRDMALRRLHYALEALATQDIELKGKRLKKFTKTYEWKYARQD